MDNASARDLPAGDRYADDRTLPNETDPATGESADDALEATRTVTEYLMPAEDASPEPVEWSTHPTQDSTQEAQWKEPYISPGNAATAPDNEDILGAEGSEDIGVDRIVDESYFENEASDLNDAEDAPLRRAATADDPHPGSEAPDLSDSDILASDEETTRGEASRR